VFFAAPRKQTPVDVDGESYGIRGGGGCRPQSIAIGLALDGEIAIRKSQVAENLEGVSRCQGGYSKSRNRCVRACVRSIHPL